MVVSIQEFMRKVFSMRLIEPSLVSLLMIALLFTAIVGCGGGPDPEYPPSPQKVAQDEAAKKEAEEEYETVIDEDTGLEVDVYMAYDNGNPEVVHNNPENPTYFYVDKKQTIYHIQDYHWNGSEGVTPGTIAIKNTETGEVYGPWQAEGQKGQFDTPNAYWNVYPDIELPPGKYEVIDSDPSTWSNNAKSGNAGVSRIKAEAE